MNIQRIRGIYLAWDIVFVIFVPLVRAKPALMFPAFVINGIVLAAIYALCNARIRRAVQDYQEKHPEIPPYKLMENENLRYHKSAHPEIQNYISERNSLTPFAAVNIIVMLLIVLSNL